MVMSAIPARDALRRRDGVARRAASGASTTRSGSASAPARLASSADVLELQRLAGNEAVTTWVQRDGGRSPGTGLSVRSPVLEETLTQVSDIAGATTGLPLNAAELALVRPVFRNSVDFSRVRLIRTDVLEYRTVGNNIRVPLAFNVDDAEMAQTLVHEMTHVWQYQHRGTSYLSESVTAQIAASIGSGNRNAAYDYVLDEDSSFFDFGPEQQATIVENRFAMLRDRDMPRQQRRYASNHQDAQGYPRQITYEERMAEIERELPDHERVVGQMRRALPRSEASLLQQRATDVMRTPGADIVPVPREREMAPTRALIELRW